MNKTETYQKLSENLKSLSSHAHDSVIGFQKAANKAESSSELLSQRFLAMMVSRRPHAEALNSRLLDIGQDQESDGSVKGAAHRALISIKELFTGTDSSAVLKEEALRGEQKLVEYIEDTFDDLDAIDEASRKAIVDLKNDVLSNIAELRQR